MPRNTRFHVPAWVGLSLALAAMLPSAGRGDTVDLNPVQDATLIQTPLGNSSGGSDGIFVGRVDVFGGGTIRRGLVQFDLTAIPSDATIDSATLTLTVAQTNHPEPRNYVLHRVVGDWGEGTSLGGGSGTDSSPGDATWTFRHVDTDGWETAGGDYLAAISATQSVADLGPYTWSGAGLIADVQAWIADPVGNAGWIVFGDESVAATVKKLYSREGAVPPVLHVVYHSNTGVGDGAAPRGIVFGPASPSPSRGPVHFSWALPRSAEASIVIVDPAGRRVRTLHSGLAAAGAHSATWDLRDATGARVPAGVYLARLSADGATRTRRVTVIH